MTQGKLIVVEAEWGTLRYYENDPARHMAILDHMIDQLTFYLKNRVTPDPDKTRRDLDGYKQLKATNDSDLIERFFDIKHELRKQGKIVRNTWLINYMKANKLWPTNSL